MSDTAELLLKKAGERMKTRVEKYDEELTDGDVKMLTLIELVYISSLLEILVMGQATHRAGIST